MGLVRNTRIAVSVLGVGILAGAIYWTLNTPQRQPVPSNYVVQLKTAPASVSKPVGQRQILTPLFLTIPKWNQDYDKSRYEVFILVTTKTTSVDHVFSSSSAFVSGGWYSPAIENSILVSHHLRPLLISTGNSSWLNVVKQGPLRVRLQATTAARVRPQDWRIVLIALTRNEESIKVLWTRVIAPYKSVTSVKS